MEQFITDLFDTTGFPPRWRCGTAWTPLLGWTHITSDSVIFFACTAIPMVLLFFVLTRKDFPFQHIFWLFIAFIFLCGATHLVEASIFWYPWYRLSALMKFLTAVVSVSTVFALVRFIPSQLKRPQYLESKINAILQNIPEAVVVTNDHGNIIHFNNAAEELFGPPLTEKKSPSLISELFSGLSLSTIKKN